LLNIGVVALGAYSGYSTAVGAMASISCLLGAVHMVSANCSGFHKKLQDKNLQIYRLIFRNHSISICCVKIHCNQ
jgi:hypothetical protein